MKRSASFVSPSSASHLCSLNLPDENVNMNFTRHVYINTEEASKEKHTIFHSPYKGGRKNPNYTNPSFMSSDVFYPRDLSPNEHSRSKAKLGLIPSRNDVIYDEQFKSRTLNKSLSGACLNRTLNKQKSRKNLDRFELDLERLAKIEKEIERDRERDGSFCKINSKVHRKFQQSKQLRQELQMMRKSPSRASHLRSMENQNPIYLENRQSVLNQLLRKESSKKELIDQMGKALRRKIEEKWLKENQKRVEKRLMDREVERFQAGVRNYYQFDRQKARLLNELLMEQILYKN